MIPGVGQAEGVNKPGVRTGQAAKAESSRGDLRQDEHGQRGVDFQEVAISWS